MPERYQLRPQIVISNTTPIIALSLIGQLHLLAKLYGEILLPTAVLDEIAAGGDKVGAIDVGQADWIKVRALQDYRRADLLTDLDRGEAETIALAQELNADLIIIDERMGRRYARHLGLTMTGTLGVLIRAKREGLIGEIGPLVEKLRHGGIRLSDELVRRTLELAGEAD